MIVHDLRNPLGIILQGKQFLQNSLKNNLSQQQNEVFLTSSRKLTETQNMISDLLDISKMEEGKFILKYDPVNLAVLAQEIVSDMNILSEEKEVSLQIRSGIPELNADKEILKRIIYNLLGNALKFSPPGTKIELTIDTNQNNIIIGMKDRGKGISEEYKEKIFDKFIQVQDNKIGRNEGKELGLAFCKMAVEAHGGRIWVESALGTKEAHFILQSLSTTNPKNTQKSK